MTENGSAPAAATGPAGARPSRMICRATASIASNVTLRRALRCIGATTVPAALIPEESRRLWVIPTSLASCVFGPIPLSQGAPNESEAPDAPVTLFPAHPARDAERSRDRLAPADAARRHDAAGSGRYLRLPAAWPARAEKDRAGCA